jgi:hypothetical protein
MLTYAMLITCGNPHLSTRLRVNRGDALLLVCAQLPAYVCDFISKLLLYGSSSCCCRRVLRLFVPRVVLHDGYFTLPQVYFLFQRLQCVNLLRVTTAQLLLRSSSGVSICTFVPVSKYFYTSKQVSTFKAPS